MIDKILVPIDFSVSSEYANEVAVSLARLFGADIIYYFIEEDKPNEIDIQQRVSNFTSKFHTTGLQVEKVFKKGVFVTSTVDYIHEQKIDLVVIGSHGMSGVNDLFLGSNTLKLMRKTPCPLIVVKERNQNFALNKIVFTSNFDNSNFGPFRTLIKLLQPFNAEIHLLNVDTPGFFKDGNTIMQPAIESFKSYAEENGFTCTTHRRTSRLVENGIHEFVKDVKPDLIVIPTSSKSALQRLFVSSVAEAVVMHADIPVMTMKL